MRKSNSGKLVIISVFSVATVLMAFYYFLTSNDSQINIQAPAHFGVPVDKGSVTVQGASLGRMLFNDPLLSKHQKISCASCHQQTASYADQGKRLSIGDRGLPTHRNAPALVNMIWKNYFFADGRANRLEETILNAINDTLELNSNIDLIVQRVAQHPIYSKKIKTLFQTQDIKGEQVIDALAQYLRTLNSSDSKYDRMLLGEVLFTDMEKKGQLIFESQCASCHIPPFFHSNVPTYDAQHRKILSPSLRNIHYSAPYMHDGRFDNLDSLLRYHPLEFSKDPQQKNLSKIEIESIHSFLKTLTDKQFLNPNSY